MTTYFIRTTLPLSEEHRTLFAQHHAETTNGNQLSVMSNSMGTECLIKCNCHHSIEEILPEDLTVLSVIEDIEEARTLLNSIEWLETPGERKCLIPAIKNKGL